MMWNNMSSSAPGRKVAVIGAGFVGASIVYALVIKGLAQEVVLIEREDCIDKCKAEVKDIRHGMPFMGASNIRAGTYADVRDCGLIVITAGRNRLPDETRFDLLGDNVGTTNAVADEIAKHYNGGIVLVVTNPVDIITQKYAERLALPKGRVFGTGCLLDSSRFTIAVADYVGLSPDVVTANVIGEHGDGQIALWSKVLISGVHIDEYCKMAGLALDEAKRKEIEGRAAMMGTSIIKGKGRTHYGIATCVCYVADSVLNHRSTIASVTSVLSGEYGISDVALSLPSVIGANGIERILQFELSDVEATRLRETAGKLRELGIRS